MDPIQPIAPREPRLPEAPAVERIHREERERRRGHDEYGDEGERRPEQERESPVDPEPEPRRGPRGCPRLSSDLKRAQGASITLAERENLQKGDSLAFRR